MSCSRATMRSAETARRRMSAHASARLSSKLICVRPTTRSIFAPVHSRTPCFEHVTSSGRPTCLALEIASMGACVCLPMQACEPAPTTCAFFGFISVLCAAQVRRGGQRKDRRNTSLQNLPHDHLRADLVRTIYARARCERLIARLPRRHGVHVHSSETQTEVPSSKD